MKFKIIGSYLVGFKGVGILLLLIAGSSYYGLHMLTNHSLYMSEVSERALAAESIRLQVQKTIMPANDFIITEKQEFVEEFNKLYEELGQAIAKFEQYGPDSEQKRLLTELKANDQGIRQISLEIFGVRNTSSNPRAVQLMEELDYKYGSKATELAQKISEIETGKIQGIIRDTNTMKSTTMLLLFISTVFALFVSYISERINKKNFAQTISRLSNVTVKIADGDLTQKIESLESDNETKKLADSINRMTRALFGIVKKLSDSSHMLAESSNEIMTVSEQIEIAVSQNAAAITEVARGAEQQNIIASESSKLTSEVVGEITEIANMASKQAEEAKIAEDSVIKLSDSIADVISRSDTVLKASQESLEASQAGEEIAVQSVSGMNNIKKVVSESTQKIEALWQKTKSISEIISVINDIAEQTNLLALNAAIEAARAGEHGKGFAVVADEVRKLAEKTAASTKEIVGLIGSVQEGANEAIEAMKEGNSEVERDAELIDNAGTSLRKITSAVSRVNKEIDQVVALTDNMKISKDKVMEVIKKVKSDSATNLEKSNNSVGSIKEMAKLIQEMNQITEQTAASSQEVSASTEEQTAHIEEMSSAITQLATMASDLKNLITAFRLESGKEVDIQVVDFASRINPVTQKELRP